MKKQKSDQNVSIARVIKVLWGIKLPWLFIILTIIARFAGTFSSIFMAGALGDMVDAEGNIAGSVMFNYAAAYIIMGVTLTANAIFYGLAGQRINMSFREKLWHRLMHIPQKYYDADGGETLVSRITTDCDYASSLLVTLIAIVSILASLGSYIGNLYSTNGYLATRILLLIPASFIVGVIYGKAKYWLGRKTQGVLADVTCYLIERTKNMPLIKLSNMSEAEQEKGSAMFDEQYRMELRAGYLKVAYQFVETALNVVGTIITFVLGASLVDRGVLTTGDVIAFYNISSAVTLDFAYMIDNCGTVRHAMGAMSRVVTALETEVEDVDKGRDLDVPNEDLHLDHVTFGYKADQPVLKDLTCLIPKNKVTAIIGANGSGKTTIFKLLERMYTPDKGVMYFGQTPAGNFSLSAWRRAFGLVAQDRPVMEGTLRENITYGCQRDVTDDELWEVARMANIDELVKSLPDGFDSYVAPGGRNFSGGQSQRIAIARAIMHDPDYLLLDEATSALDAKSERAVTDALHTLMEGRTTIIIAHNLSAIRHADHVLVIRDGQLSAHGSPTDIIKTSENYRTLVTNRNNA